MKRFNVLTILSVWVFINMLTVAGWSEMDQPSLGADFYLKRGKIYHKKGQYDQAISEFNKAIELNPRLTEAYYQRGLARAENTSISDLDLPPCEEIERPTKSGKRVVPPELKDCVEKHSLSECCPCVAGGDYELVYVPDSAGVAEIPGDSAPEAVWRVAVASYDYDTCDCFERWKFKVDGKWVSFDNPIEFCKHLTNYNKECGGCLVTWKGDRIEIPRL
jgi:hypothetical protein